MLSHRLLGVHAEPIVDNQALAARIASVTELPALASSVNARGSDVFDSHDVLAAGMEDNLSKPVDIDRLGSCIDKRLKQTMKFPSAPPDACETVRW